MLPFAFGPRRRRQEPVRISTSWVALVLVRQSVQRLAPPDRLRIESLVIADRTYHASSIHRRSPHLSPAVSSRAFRGSAACAICRGWPKPPPSPRAGPVHLQRPKPPSTPRVRIRSTPQAEACCASLIQPVPHSRPKPLRSPRHRS